MRFVGWFQKSKSLPFPGVVDALYKLRGAGMLVILSNGDRDMLEAAKPHWFSFHLVISVRGRLLQAALENLREGRGADWA